MSLKKVLVCDDDEDILDMMEIILSPHFETVCEADSRLVLERTEAFRPDTIIVDLWMPLMPGDQLIRNIRANAGTEQTTIIVISASPTGEQIALDAGADLFIAKPFDIAHLINAVKETIH